MNNCNLVLAIGECFWKIVHEGRKNVRFRKGGTSAVGAMTLALKWQSGFRIIKGSRIYLRQGMKNRQKKNYIKKIK